MQVNIYYYYCKIRTATQVIRHSEVDSIAFQPFYFLCKIVNITQLHKVQKLINYLFEFRTLTFRNIKIKIKFLRINYVILITLMSDSYLKKLSLYNHSRACL